MAKRGTAKFRRRRGLGMPLGIRVVDEAIDAGACSSAVSALVHVAQSGSYPRAVLTEGTRRVVGCYRNRTEKAEAAAHGILRGTKKKRRK